MSEKGRLSAASFYSLIAGGLVLGVVLAIAAAGDGRAEGRRIWADVGESFVIPVAAMTGATFGGLAGVAVAIALEKGLRP